MSEPVPAASAETSRKRQKCAISGRETKSRDLVPLSMLRPNLVDRIRRDHPDLAGDARVGRAEISRFRALYVEELLKDEHGEFTELDRQVTESIAKQDTIAEDTEAEFSDQRTVGEKLADQLAKHGGSWAFLGIFFALLAIWMAYNLIVGEKAAFDAYPFILLNLVLSCLAAVQAPIIMMSQRRQEQKDRRRSENDYRVNLKAELEIRHLHEKMDHLIIKQWTRLAEIQQLQFDSMDDRSVSE